MLAKLVFRGRTFHAKEASRAEVPGRSVSGMGGNGRRPEGAARTVGRRLGTALWSREVCCSRWGPHSLQRLTGSQGLQ